MRDRDMLPGEEGAHAESRARSALAVEAVAERDNGWLSAAAKYELSALTCCFSDHAAEFSTARSSGQIEMVCLLRVGCRDSYPSGVLSFAIHDTSERQRRS